MNWSLIKIPNISAVYTSIHLLPDLPFPFSEMVWEQDYAVGLCQVKAYHTALAAASLEVVYRKHCFPYVAVLSLIEIHNNIHNLTKVVGP